MRAMSELVMPVSGEVSKRYFAYSEFERYVMPSTLRVFMLDTFRWGLLFVSLILIIYSMSECLSTVFLQKHENSCDDCKDYNGKYQPAEVDHDGQKQLKHLPYEDKQYGNDHDGREDQQDCGYHSEFPLCFGLREYLVLTFITRGAGDLTLVLRTLRPPISCSVISFLIIII